MPKTPPLTTPATQRPTSAFNESLLHYLNVGGKEADERYGPYLKWLNKRRKHGIWPYSKVLMGHVGHTAHVANEVRQNAAHCINFGSQDYLGLAQREELKAAVRETLDEFGVHSAGSPVLCGRTSILVDLEQKLCGALKREECIIYATGWAAGFGVITGLVRAGDTILLDALSHNCLQEGARHATRQVVQFPHNDLEALADLLHDERDKNPDNGLFVVLESLYSMDSDSPNLAAMMKLARQYEALVILDVAHDFGAMGKRGLGLLETVSGEMEPDVIMGSFSKTFAANGGFVACSRVIRDYLAYYSAPHVFSNAISPMQTAVVSRAFDMVFSEEGNALRGALMKNVLHLRAAMEQHSMTVAGTPSPIVPVFVGDEKIARLTSKHLTGNGLLANLVEFPAVPLGKARFRFQVMACHEPAAIERAAEIMAASREAAEQEWAVIAATEKGI